MGRTGEVNGRIALLRGVNVGGKRKVSMAELQAVLVAMGLASVRTLLNSGNAVFRSDLTPAALEDLLETEVAQRLGLKTDFHVRTAAEWRALIEANPLPGLVDNRPDHLVVCFLKMPPTPEAIATLRAAHPGPETICVDRRQLYIDYSAHGIGRSKLTPSLLDTKLGVRGTARNWNTVLKLADLVSRLGG